MGTFAAIDFETANEQRNSPCAVGVVCVEDREVVDRWSSLIDPQQPFSAMNTMIHGITSEDIDEAPTFPEVLPEIADRLDECGTLVAHSAAFDVQVLNTTAARYQVGLEEYPFACTWVFARHWWPGWPSYSLGYVVETLELEAQLDGPGHHDELWDADAAAHIALRGLKSQAVAGWQDAATEVGVRLGTCGGSVYRGCVTKHSGGGQAAPIDPTRDPDAALDEDHPLFGKTVCFTGALEAFTRREAAQKVVDGGGEYANNVTKTVDLLVVGRQDLAKLNGKKVSSKMAKASKMAADGHPIEIIDEVDFYRLAST